MNCKKTGDKPEWRRKLNDEEMRSWSTLGEYRERVSKQQGAEILARYAELDSTGGDEFDGETEV